MDLVKTIMDHTGARAEKHYKTTLWRSDTLLLGINCLEPGQVQKAHDHQDQDKFYYIIEGTGRFQLGTAQINAATGQVIWAPAGMVHGVTNDSDGRLTLLVGIAPAP